MPRSTKYRQREPNGRFLSSHARVTPGTTQHTASLLALPPELRVAIYKNLFRATNKHTLRRPTEITTTTATPNIKLINTSILTTCKAIHTEAAPHFYASRTFHASTPRDTLSHQPITISLSHLPWLHHLSISHTLTTQSYPQTDATLAPHIRLITAHCTKLRTFTLHLIPGCEHLTARNMPLSLTPPHNTGETAIALRALRPRLDRLTVVLFGGWHTLLDLRAAIADSEHWVEGRRGGGWPGLSLDEAQRDTVGVQQRRYAVAGGGDVVHPHFQCVRAFHCFKGL